MKVVCVCVCAQVYGFDGTSWKEDSAWTAQLDKAWDLGAVRDAAYKALAQVRAVRRVNIHSNFYVS